MAGYSGTPLAKKLGIRASDTATVVFENCRIPFGNILGKAEVKTKTEGFKGAMATFDATRPIVAAMALGVMRAALDMLRDVIEKEGIKIRYNAPRTAQTALERDFMEMEANYKAARLLTIRAVWLMQNGLANPDNAGAASTDYMHLFGLTALAYMWCLIAKTCQAKIAASDTDPFYATKLILGRYYMQRILPDTTGHLAKLTSGSELMMALPAEAF